jgi:hypothetical protein
METYPDYEKSPLADLAKAFERAWAVLQARDPNNQEELKLQLQRTLLILSAEGVTDARQLSSLALEKFSAKPSFPRVPFAKELIQNEDSSLEPETMPNECAKAVDELVRVKDEPRAQQAELGQEKYPRTKVSKFIDAVKKALQSKGRQKVREAVRRMGERLRKERADSSPAHSDRRPSRTSSW